MCSNKNLKQTETATENAWKSYGKFSEDFQTSVQVSHEKNLKFINLSSDTPYTDPELTDVIVENTSLLDLCQTCGNMELNKVIMVFATLCSEMSRLAKIGLDEFIEPIVMYGEDRVVHDDIEPDGEDLTDMSKMISILHDLLCFTNRCMDVVKNVMQQLESLFNVWRKSKASPNKPFIDADGIRFDLVFESLGQVAVTLLNIDEVLSNQSLLKRDFVSYKRMMELISKDVTKFGVDSDQSYKVKALFEVISLIEKEVIDAYDDPKDGHKTFFRRMIDSMDTSISDGIVSKNSILCDQFSSYIRSCVSDYEAEGNTIRDDRRWLALNTLFISYVWLFRKDDKRLLKSILDSEKKTGTLVCHLKGNVFVFPDRMLSEKLPKGMVEKKVLDTLNTQRDQIMRNVHVEKEVKSLSCRLISWMVSFEMAFDSKTDASVTSINQQIKCMEEGLELSIIGSSLMKNCVYLHLNSGRAMSKSDLIGVCKLIGILTAVNMTYERKKASVLLGMSAYAQYHSYVALNALSIMKKRLVADVKKYSEKKLDAISAVILSSNCFHGPILTESRQIIASLCLAMTIQSMNETETTKIIPSFNKIGYCSKILNLVRDKTNCDFIYFNRAVLGIYFAYCYEHELSDIRAIRYFFAGLHGSTQLISNGLRHDELKAKETTKRFKDEVYEKFKSEYLDKLCADFETELRLQTHQELQLDDQSPFKRKLPDFLTPLKSDAIKFFDTFICINRYVEEYLNEITYNLTTIALHDWKTYESMLSLAKSKYGLEFVTSQLPTQTLEQGLDVLEITRSIHIFVTKYLYNLNNQMFIEKSSENKHLNVLLIRHVANSIQTHGYGVINTAVNFTYQYLRKKFYTFSQFLYQEQIKSRLIKDLRHFRESKSNKFSYDVADKFVRGIRKLGLNPDGLSYLDQMRVLITEVGNALGFVRMLRSGALHCSSSSVNFVPDLDDLNEISFETLAKEDNFNGDQLLMAAQNLDTVLSCLNRNFSEATDYFKLLVSVFSSTLRDPKNIHLKNFFVILPALTISYVEHMIISKEKLSRKNKVGALFTDDGFSMGVAYVLKLLNQVSDFDSLQWFYSVREKVTIERNEAIKEKNAGVTSATDDRLTQTTSLTLKRLEVLQKEFEVLNYNLTSCRILFRSEESSNQ